MPGIAKKRLLRKKFKKHLFSSSQKTKTAQTGDGSVFAERIEKVKRTKFELETHKKFCTQKIMFWFNLPLEMRKFCVLRAFLKGTILKKKIFLKSTNLNVKFFLKSMILNEKVFVESKIFN